jgi:hypothetical protein
MKFFILHDEYLNTSRGFITHEDQETSPIELIWGDRVARTDNTAWAERHNAVESTKEEVIAYINNDISSSIRSFDFSILDEE